jgi:hypothetical protein
MENVDCGGESYDDDDQEEEVYGDDAHDFDVEGKDNSQIFSVLT